MTTDELIDDILDREGGFVNHPNDRGGPTKYGITQATLSEWRGKRCSIDDVRALTEVEAREIYKKNYIIDPGFDRILNPKLMALVVDCGVNHGPSRATKWLQRVVNVIEDGVIGTKTLAEVNHKNPMVIYYKLLALRIRFYGQIISSNHSQAVFARGWLNRAAEFLDG